MGKDECKIDVLSCFEMEHLFLTLEEGKLFRDFSANFAYIFFKFKFVVYHNSKLLKIFGNGDFCVFTIKLRRGLRLSHEDCFRVLCWVSSHTISLEPYVFTSGVIVDGFFNFRGLFVGINYPRVVCVGSLSERLTKG